MRRFPMVVATGLAVAFLTACDEEAKRQKTFVASCEEVLKERLQAPSTYIRVRKPDVRVETRPIDDGEFEAMIDNDRYSSLQDYVREKRAAGESYVEWTWYETIIHYDEDNTYGTPIRDLASCKSKESHSGMPGDFDVRRFAVAVRGETQHEWTMERSRRLIEAYRRLSR